MDKFKDFLEPIRLYHGTTAAYWPEIKRAGLVPQRRSAMEWFQLYYPGEQMPAAVKERISQRQTLDDVLGVIHLTPVREQAVDYARLLAKYGGENGYLYWQMFNDWRQVAPLYAGSGGIVMAIDIPKNMVWKKNSVEYLSKEVIPLSLIKQVDKV